jgi:hypothetical protein
MSEETKNTLDLVPGDIIGAVQRMCHELNAYLSQHAAKVDPNVCMAYLERMAQFTRTLPVQHVANGAGGEAPEARVN